MKMLDRSRVYSEVAGSFNGYEQDGILFLKNGMPFDHDPEEVQEVQEEEETQKPAIKKEVLDKAQENKTQVKKRRGRPPKKKTIIAVSETETLPETHPIISEKSIQEKNYDRSAPILEQTQITDDNEVII